MNGPINGPLKETATTRVAASLTLLLCIAINVVGALHGLMWL